MATQLLKTVKPTGGDYTSLEACMNANEQNLVSADKYFDVEIDGDWSGGADTTAVVIHNYTTDSTRYINIYTTATARHSGVYTTSKYLLFPSADATPMTVSINYDTGKISVVGLQIDGTNRTGAGNDGSDGVVLCASYMANQLWASNIIKSNTVSGLSVNSSRGTSYVYNNIIYGTTATAYSDGICYSGSSNIKIYNNLVWKFHRGTYRGGSGITLTNNILLASGETDIDTSAGVPSGEYNATSDGKGDDSPLTNGLVNQTSYSDYFVSVTAGSEDFNLKAGSDFIGVGTDLSGTFTTDAAGVTRGATWDMGPLAYDAGTPPTTNSNFLAFM